MVPGLVPSFLLAAHPTPTSSALSAVVGPVAAIMRAAILVAPSLAVATATALLPAVFAADTAAAHASLPALFEEWGTIVYGNLDLSSSTLEGPALVLGTADLVDFDVGGGRPCHPTAPALAVGSAAYGRHGVLKGRAALGRRSVLDDSVGLPCADPADASRGVEVDGAAGVGTDTWALRLRHVTDSRAVCGVPPTGRVVVEDSVLKLYPAPPSAGDACVDVFVVRDPPSSLTSVQYFGRRRMVINYFFRSASWAGLDMATLVAATTLHSYCGGGSLRLRDTEVSGSVLAPGLRVDSRASEIRGRLAVESITGQAVVRYEAYTGVAPARLAAEACAA